MKTFIKLPDGSAFDASTIAAIRFRKGDEPGKYLSLKPRVSIDTWREPGMFAGFGSRLVAEQAHYVEFETDEDAQRHCREWVDAWMGVVPAPAVTA